MLGRLQARCSSRNRNRTLITERQASGFLQQHGLEAIALATCFQVLFGDVANCDVRVRRQDVVDVPPAPPPRSRVLASRGRSTMCAQGIHRVSSIARRDEYSA